MTPRIPYQQVWLPLLTFTFLANPLHAPSAMKAMILQWIIYIILCYFMIWYFLVCDWHCLAIYHPNVPKNKKI